MKYKNRLMSDILSEELAYTHKSSRRKIKKLAAFLQAVRICKINAARSKHSFYFISHVRMA